MVIRADVMSRKSLLLTLFLSTPFVLIAGLMWYFATTVNADKPVAHAAPVGAGWGATGGANGIGELIAGNKVRAMGASTPAPAAAAPAHVNEPKLVQPESLEQGFILIVQDKAGMASPATPIHIAGGFNNWNPGDPSFRLEAQSDMKWRIRMPQPPGGRPIEFKFTRGGWDRCEIAADMADISNRKLAPIDVSTLKAGELPKIELTVEKWADMRGGEKAPAGNDPYRVIAATGDLRRVQVMGGAGSAKGQVRDVLVWLPPGYDAPENAAKRYPVLYLHDGQNIFEKLPNVPGEWGADETATALLKDKAIEPVIIVGVPHSGAGRIAEYSPVTVIKGVEPQGAQHIAWLVGEVKPRIERAFRVDTRRERTAVGGSSLGAVIALEAFREHPEAFGMVLAESLPLRTGQAAAWEQWLGTFEAWPDRIFLGMGGREAMGPAAEAGAAENKYVTAVKALNERLARAGVSEDRRMLLIVPDAEHTESAWAERFPAALRFLFPAGR
jgi:predicted alpha/beta superfamily hydrolase